MSEFNISDNVDVVEQDEERRFWAGVRELSRQEEEEKKRRTKLFTALKVITLTLSLLLFLGIGIFIGMRYDYFLKESILVSSTTPVNNPTRVAVPEEDIPNTLKMDIGVSHIRGLIFRIGQSVEFVLPSWVEPKEVHRLEFDSDTNIYSVYMGEWIIEVNTKGTVWQTKKV